jgi:hypothetical protein
MIRAIFMAFLKVSGGQGEGGIPMSGFMFGDDDDRTASPFPRLHGTMTPVTYMFNLGLQSARDNPPQGLPA